MSRAVVLGAAAALGGDALVYEPQFPVLTTYHVEMPNLPGKLDGFKVVHLTDIHRRGITPDSVIKRAVEFANSTDADAAVLTGDFVGRDLDDIDPCFDMLSCLETRLGSFAVLGNHDHWLDAEAVSHSMIRHGITLLQNENVEIADGLHLVGIDDAWVGEPDAEKALEGIRDDCCCVYLSHIPKGVELFADRTGLLLSGHTHGGQIRLPSLKRAPGPGGKTYIEGWYRQYGIMMYVSRGVGMSILPVRFRCRPEVTLFVLHPSPDHNVSLIPVKD